MGQGLDASYYILLGVLNGDINCKGCVSYSGEGVISFRGYGL